MVADGTANTETVRHFFRKGSKFYALQQQQQKNALQSRLNRYNFLLFTLIINKF